MTLECAVGHLKTCRWALRTLLEVKKENMLHLIGTTCFLHNICEITWEVFCEAWGEEAWYAEQAWRVEYVWSRDAVESKPPPSSDVGSMDLTHWRSLFPG